MNQIAERPKLSALPSTVTKALQPSEVRYISLNEGERIGIIAEKRLIEITDHGTKGILADLVKSVLFSSGQNKAIDPLDFKMLVQDFYNKLKEFNNHTTIDEIREALTLGVTHKLTSDDNPTGKYLGINTSTFFDWINLFMFQNERLAALRKRNEMLAKAIEPKAELTTDDLKDIQQECIESSLNHFKRTGNVLNMGNAVFRALWSQKKIRFNEEEKQKLLIVAKDILNKDLIEQRKKAKKKFDRLSLIRIENDLMEIEEENSTSVTITAGTIAVKKYFESLK